MRMVRLVIRYGNSSEVCLSWVYVCVSAGWCVGVLS